MQPQSANLVGDQLWLPVGVKIKWRGGKIMFTREEECMGNIRSLRKTHMQILLYTIFSNSALFLWYTDRMS